MNCSWNYTWNQTGNFVWSLLVPDLSICVVVWTCVQIVQISGIVISRGFSSSNLAFTDNLRQLTKFKPSRPKNGDLTWKIFIGMKPLTFFAGKFLSVRRGLKWSGSAPVASGPDHQTHVNQAWTSFRYSVEKSFYFLCIRTNATKPNLRFKI